MKKLVSILLIIAMVITGLSAGFAAFGEEGDAANDAAEESTATAGTSTATILVRATEKRYKWGDEIGLDVEVTNTGAKTLHNLTVNSKPRRAAHFWAEDGADSAKIDTLAPGETKTVRLTYTAERWSAFKRASGSPMSAARSLFSSFVSGVGTLHAVTRVKVGWFHYRFKIGVSGEGLEAAKPVKGAKPTGSSEITLTSSVSELMKESGKAQVYFYAECHKAPETISLIDGAGKTVATMKDDGYYAESSDDLQGDGIYSCKLELDKNVDTDYTFRASYDNVTSKDLTVKVIKPLTSEELKAIETVDTALKEKVFAAPAFESADTQGRKELAKGVLEGMKEQGLIDGGSIFYSETNSAYTFKYSSGILGAVLLNDWGEETNGPDDDTTAAAAGTYNAVTSTASVGDAIILWSFDQAWDTENFRKPFYSQLEKDWNAMGLTTTVDWNVTVDDYKNLSGYEVIVFSGHGAYETYKYDGKEETHASLLLSETATSEKDKAYSADLKEFRIGHIAVAGGTKYAILPEFFDHYYQEGDLSGAFIFAENCEFRGNDGKVNDEMPQALLDASAEAVVGFHNSVDGKYSRNLMNDYVEALVDGQTAEGAFDTARDQRGKDDGNGAYPLMEGNEDAVLVHTGIQNGDFEQAATPVKWGATGDTRVIAKLGDLQPQSGSRMAIITTGIGSGESVYLEGTEGSILQQSFKVDASNKKLSFRYDVVSEEPTEYVGTKYDDTFVAELIDENGNVVETIAKASINTCDWHSISGINFDGGDNTTYHTKWQSVSFDLSKYVGHQVTLRFKTYDKGDSIYDTAVLIDAVATTAK
ncbi:MAG: choice-of-anchor L domain-containing protein [Clostridia bacterium]|nr:choice-of-anchor L domain-containing protein [Clostridia bacterium]